MQEFIEKIVKNLESNGFPQKKVSLPTEKMYEAADNRGLSFNKVLEQMNKESGIEADIGTEKIVFSKPDAPNLFEDPSQNEMLQKAQEMMSQMDPEELQKIQESVLNMSEEDREELMKKGRDLGLL